MAEINAEKFTAETTEMILKLPESSNQVNALTIIAAAGAGRTVTVTANTQTASSLDEDAYEAPDDNSVVDVADGLPHTFLFPIGTMINKLKFTPSGTWAYSVKCSSARA
jgi:hypothetical protein